MDYIATCKGDISGRIIKIKGQWHGVNVSESDAILHLTSIDNPLDKKTFKVTKDLSLKKIL